MKRTLLTALLITAAVSFARPVFDWDEVSKGPGESYHRQYGRQQYQSPWQRQQQFNRHREAAGRQFGREQFEPRRFDRYERDGRFTPRPYGDIQSRRNFATPQKFDRYDRLERFRDMHAQRHQQGMRTSGQYPGERFGQDRGRFEGFGYGRTMPYRRGFEGRDYRGYQKFDGHKGPQAYGQQRFAYPNIEKFRGCDEGKCPFERAGRPDEKRFNYPQQGKFGEDRFKGRYEHKGEGKGEYPQGPRMYKGMRGECKGECPMNAEGKKGKFEGCPKEDGKEKCPADAMKAPGSERDRREQMHRRGEAQGQRMHGNREPQQGGNTEVKELKLKLRDAVMDNDYDRAERIINRLRDIND